MTEKRSGELGGSGGSKGAGLEGGSKESVLDHEGNEVDGVVDGGLEEGVITWNR